MSGISPCQNRTTPSMWVLMNSDQDLRSLIIVLLVVQCDVHRICSCDSLYEVDHSATLPSGVSSTSLECIRHHSPSIHGSLLSILHHNYYRQNLGMHPKSQDMG